MKYLHTRVYAGSRAEIQLSLSRRANVKLMDDTNFRAYQAGRRYNCRGFSASGTARLAVPHAGHWNVVVDLGGYAGSVQVSNVVVLGG